VSDGLAVDELSLKFSRCEGGQIGFALRRVDREDADGLAFEVENGIEAGLGNGDLKFGVVVGVKGYFRAFLMPYPIRLWSVARLKLDLTRAPSNPRLVYSGA
jgi:hypothetical protein